MTLIPRPDLCTAVKVDVRAREASLSLRDSDKFVSTYPLTVDHTYYADDSSTHTLPSLYGSVRLYALQSNVTGAQKRSTPNKANSGPSFQAGHHDEKQ